MAAPVGDGKGNPVAWGHLLAPERPSHMHWPSSGLLLPQSSSLLPLSCLESRVSHSERDRRHSGRQQASQSSRSSEAPGESVSATAPSTPSPSLPRSSRLPAPAPKASPSSASSLTSSASSPPLPLSRAHRRRPSLTPSSLHLLPRARLSAGLASSGPCPSSSEEGGCSRSLLSPCGSSSLRASSRLPPAAEEKKATRGQETPTPAAAFHVSLLSEQTAVSPACDGGEGGDQARGGRCAAPARASRGGRDAESRAQDELRGGREREARSDAPSPAESQKVAKAAEDAGEADAEEAGGSQSPTRVRSPPGDGDAVAHGSGCRLGVESDRRRASARGKRSVLPAPSRRGVDSGGVGFCVKEDRERDKEDDVEEDLAARFHDSVAAWGHSPLGRENAVQMRQNSSPFSNSTSVAPPASRELVAWAQCLYAELREACLLQPPPFHALLARSRRTAEVKRGAGERLTLSRGASGDEAAERPLETERCQREEDARQGANGQVIAALLETVELLLHELHREQRAQRDQEDFILRRGSEWRRQQDALDAAESAEREERDRRRAAENAALRATEASRDALRTLRQRHALVMEKNRALTAVVRRLSVDLRKKERLCDKLKASLGTLLPLPCQQRVQQLTPSFEITAPLSRHAALSPPSLGVPNPSAAQAARRRSCLPSPRRAPRHSSASPVGGSGSPRGAAQSGESPSPLETVGALEEALEACFVREVELVRVAHKQRDRTRTLEFEVKQLKAQLAAARESMAQETLAKRARARGGQRRGLDATSRKSSGAASRRNATSSSISRGEPERPGARDSSASPDRQLRRDAAAAAASRSASAAPTLDAELARERPEEKRACAEDNKEGMRVGTSRPVGGERVGAVAEHAVISSRPSDASACSSRNDPGVQLYENEPSVPCFGSGRPVKHCPSPSASLCVAASSPVALIASPAPEAVLPPASAAPAAPQGSLHPKEGLSMESEKRDPHWTASEASTRSTSRCGSALSPSAGSFFPSLHGQHREAAKPLHAITPPAPAETEELEDEAGRGQLPEGGGADAETGVRRGGRAAERHHVRAGEEGEDHNERETEGERRGGEPTQRQREAASTRRRSGAGHEGTAYRRCSLQEQSEPEEPHESEISESSGRTPAGGVALSALAAVRDEKGSPSFGGGGERAQRLNGASQSASVAGGNYGDVAGVLGAFEGAPASLFCSPPSSTAFSSPFTFSRPSPPLGAASPPAPAPQRPPFARDFEFRQPCAIGVGEARPTRGAAHDLPPPSRGEGGRGDHAREAYDAQRHQLLFSSLLQTEGSPSGAHEASSASRPARGPVAAPPASAESAWPQRVRLETPHFAGAESGVRGRVSIAQPRRFALPQGPPQPAEALPGGEGGQPFAAPLADTSPKTPQLLAASMSLRPQGAVCVAAPAHRRSPSHTSSPRLLHEAAARGEEGAASLFGPSPAPAEAFRVGGSLGFRQRQAPFEPDGAGGLGGAWPVLLWEPPGGGVDCASPFKRRGGRAAQASRAALPPSFLPSASPRPVSPFSKTSSFMSASHASSAVGGRCSGSSFISVSNSSGGEAAPWGFDRPGKPLYTGRRSALDARQKRCGWTAPRAVLRRAAPDEKVAFRVQRKGGNSFEGCVLRMQESAQPIFDIGGVRILHAFQRGPLYWTTPPFLNSPVLSAEV
ncbi:hypothetical protein BESB_046220 [Besnoitia besnoiti]|uniref:Uncharacterized protein n=1 Tax=Besnoitia besnoiti TaxID=94643 RepID=A0A2A9MLR8_BESBE|nr:hypothetical protein BESB_046220 [Besnoitia besnoiti]PFH36430.1 hypothetical protein BESB_046220 [Besnoitia besnoiti]